LNSQAWDGSLDPGTTFAAGVAVMTAAAVAQARRQAVGRLLIDDGSNSASLRFALEAIFGKNRSSLRRPTNTKFGRADGHRTAEAFGKAT
jgi:hypothetical protein